MTPFADADAGPGSVRRAALRLACIAGLAALLWFWDGGAWEVPVWFAFAAAALAWPAGRPSPGWLATEPAGEWDVVLDAPGSRPIYVIKTVRAATGWSLVAAKDAVDGAPGPVARGVPGPAADRLVAELTEGGAAAHREASGSAGV